MQAARGASLSTEDHADGHAEPRRSSQDRSSLAGRLVIGVVLAYTLDQATKIWAVARLEGEPSIELIPGVLSLTFLRNPGAAFGMAASLTVGLSLVSVVVVAVVIKMAARLRDPGWAIGLGLLLAGALGNLTDRLLREPGVLRGHVVDFIDYGPFVGNVADIYLTFAAIVIIWRSFKGVGLDGTRVTG